MEGRDQDIEALEAEIRQSRFTPWDVETFLANRYQAKIDALTAPKGKWARRWAVAKEVGSMLVLGLVLLSIGAGLERSFAEPKVRYYDAEGRLAPPPAPPAYRINQ